METLKKMLYILRENSPMRIISKKMNLSYFRSRNVLLIMFCLFVFFILTKVPIILEGKEISAN